MTTQPTTPNPIDLRTISATDLACLGQNVVAFVRPVPATDRTPEGYGIFMADGTQVGLAPDRRHADVLVRQHDMEPVSVH